MKICLLLLFFTISTAFAGTCSNTTRTNYSANTVLTSSALNADFNQLVTKANAFDGGCVTDGTLEFAALNATDFSSIVNGIQSGCKVSFSNSNTLSIGKCIATVNGFSIKTTSANTVTWGCSGCSSEVASTQYYLYIKTGSTGTTLNLLISTTAPNEDGYDSSNNKILAKFYENSASDIDTLSIDQWRVNEFVPQAVPWTLYTPTLTGFGTTTPTTNMCRYSRSAGDMLVDCNFTQGTLAATFGTIKLPSGIVMDTTKIFINNTNGNPGQIFGQWDQQGNANTFGNLVTAPATDSTLLYLSNPHSSAAALTPIASMSAAVPAGTLYNMRIRVPIVGW